MTESKAMLDESAFLKHIRQVAEAGPFTPSWDLLSGCQTPQWYMDAKFRS